MSFVAEGCGECGNVYMTDVPGENCPCGCIYGYSICRQDHAAKREAVMQAVRTAEGAAEPVIKLPAWCLTYLQLSVNNGAPAVVSYATAVKFQEELEKVKRP